MSEAGLVIVWSGGPRRDVHRIREVPQPEWGFVFGREHCDASDQRVSGTHAGFRVEGRWAAIQDLGSRNGTFVDGTALESGGTIARAWVPAVVRAGHTVAIVVQDVRPYEDVLAAGDDAVLAAAQREVDAAARAEENLTIEGPYAVGIELARQYANVVGGETIEFDPARDKSLDNVLANRRPRTVILALVEHALGDLHAVNAWLETDVRFVTLVMPDTQALSMLPADGVAQLRRRVIGVGPRFVGIGSRVVEVVRDMAPKVTVHPTVIEKVLIQSKQTDEPVLFEQLREGVARWLADRANDAQLGTDPVLRGDHLELSYAGPGFGAKRLPILPPRPRRGV